MRKHRAARVAVAALFVTVLGFVTPAAGHEAPAPFAPAVLASAPTDLGAIQLTVYVHALEENAAAERAAADQARELAAFVASIPPPPVAAPTGITIPVASGSGGHSDAWWHGVAQCEQGGRNDPFFGYFSFMDGSMGGQPWDVQVAAGNAVLARSGSESPAWAPSCVAAGYAAASW